MPGLVSRRAHAWRGRSRCTSSRRRGSGRHLRSRPCVLSEVQSLSVASCMSSSLGSRSTPAEPKHASLDGCGRWRHRPAKELPRSAHPFRARPENKMPIPAHPSRRTHPGARSIVVVSIVSWDGGANGPGANGPVCSARARLLRRRAPSSYDRSRCLRCPGDCSVTTQISRNRLRLPAAHFYAISTVHL